MIDAIAREGFDVLDREAGPSRLRHLAWPLGFLGLLTVAATMTLVFLNRAAIHSIDQVGPVQVIIPIGYAIIGALLASRRSRNPIGWIFLGIAIFTGLLGVAQQYLFRNWHIHRLPFAAWAAWSHDWVSWLVFPSGLVVLFFLLFPDGHLQSRRWRWFAWFAAAVWAVGFAVNVLQKTIEVAGSPVMRSPLTAASVDSNNGPTGLVWLAAFGVLVTAMVGTILRTRLSTGDLRQQLRWLAYATSVIVVGLVVFIVFGLFLPTISSVWLNSFYVLGFGVAIPVSCAIAILKHGLYQLDLVISKTVVYGLLAAFFTAVYLAVVVGIGAAFGSTRNPFLTVLAAAVIALAFNPVRERARRFANRVVFGERATPYEVLSGFAEHMAGTYEIEDVIPRTARMLAEGTGAVRADVWLRVGRELLAEGSWPSAPTIARVSLEDTASIDVPGASRAVAVRHQGELLGAISLQKGPGDPITPTEEKLLADVASQAGLVLRNVRLIEDLRASRQRLVVAQDEERRKIERNIHDGAQQQLVAMAVKLRMANQLVERDPERSRTLHAGLEGELTDALENLRDLARGIYPPLLADQGLVAALRSQAGKSAVPVSVDADGIGRFSQDAEAAVYFCTLEALQNVAKYAQATAATVRLQQQDGDLAFDITDDGIGFDPAARGYGTGMQGMADRLAALGGELSVRSSPGAGTTVMGRVPVRAAAPGAVPAGP